MNERRDDNELRSEFWDFFNANRNSRYGPCLRDFLTGLLKENADNITSIVLFGGLVRDGMPIPGWSDIDLLVVFQKIVHRDAQSLARLVDRAQTQYGISIDLTQVDAEALSDPLLLANCYNSEILNALAMRANVSAVVYGMLPRVHVSPTQEKMAARFYIDHTMAAFRRYLIEHAYRGDGQEHYRRSVARVTRWLFSIIRASLRLFDIYVHPYDPSLEQVAVLFPDIDLSVPYGLLEMRTTPDAIRIDYALFGSMEEFLQKYVACVLRKATDGQLMGG